MFCDTVWATYSTNPNNGGKYVQNSSQFLSAIHPQFKIFSVAGK